MVGYASLDSVIEIVVSVAHGSFFIFLSWSCIVSLIAFVCTATTLTLCVIWVQSDTFHVCQCLFNCSHTRLWKIHRCRNTLHGIINKENQQTKSLQARLIAHILSQCGWFHTLVASALQSCFPLSTARNPLSISPNENPLLSRMQQESCV